MLPLNQIFRLFPFVALYASASAFLSAQAHISHPDFNPRFERFQFSGGEAANRVQYIAQDTLGFLWFASSEGLLRYDRQGFVTYRHDPLGSNSIVSDYVAWIFEDTKGMLWLGHWGGGVTVFNPATGEGSFKHLLPRAEMDDPGISSEDENGNFRLLYFTLFITGIYTLYRFQLKRRLEHAEILRLQEPDAIKTKFYTNINHEFPAPIVMITAKADAISKREGLERGADAYLTKPFRREELLLRIRKLLEMRLHLQHHHLLAAGLNDEAVQKETASASVIEHAFVQKARSIVEDHMDDLDFDVEQFCRAMTMSHPQVHRKLSALTGLSANKFIRSIRLNKAKSLLMDPEMTITAVAFDSGFNDSSYFGKIFKQEFGLTPAEWRKRYGSAGYKSDHST